MVSSFIHFEMRFVHYLFLFSLFKNIHSNSMHVCVTLKLYKPVQMETQGTTISEFNT